jgi:GAF domain-containing protein
MNSSALIAALRSISVEVIAGAPLASMLRTTCEVTQRLLGVEHAALVLFDEARSKGRVAAEFPGEFKAIGTSISLLEPIERKLILELEPIHVEKLAEPKWEKEFGTVYQTLRDMGLQSILIVPIVCKGRAVGSFSLDVLDVQRRFNDDEIDVCRLIAGAIATAIDTDTWTRRTAELRDAAVALNATRSSSNMFDMVVTNAVKLLDARAGGFYKWDAKSRTLTLIADQSRPGVRGITLGLGEGIAGKLILDSSRRVRPIPDYRQDPDRSDRFGSTPPFESALEVRLESTDGTPYGILYVDDHAGRKFTDSDQRLLELFADEAQRALKGLETDGQMESLTAVAKSFQALLSGTSPNDGCDRLARLLVAEIRALFCRVLSFPESGPVVLGVAVGHPKNSSLDRDLRTLAQDNPKMSLKRIKDLDTGWCIIEGSEALYLFPHNALSGLYRVLLVGLKTDNGVEGLLEIGLGPASAGPDLAVLGSAMSAQFGLLLRTLQERELGLRQYSRLLKSVDTAQKLVPENNFHSIEAEVPRIAADVSNAKAAALFAHRETSNTLSALAKWGPMEAGAWSACLNSPGMEIQVKLPTLQDRDIPSWVGSMITVPLAIGGVVKFIIWLWLDRETPDPSSEDIQLLSLFGRFAATGLRLGRTHGTSDPLGWSFLTVFARITAFQQNEQLESKVLHAGLTAVTARYGLRFNRAAVFLLNDDHTQVVCVMGIGQLEKGRAQSGWNIWEHSEQNNVNGYLTWLSKNLPVESDVEREIRNLPIPVSREGSDPFSRAVFQQEVSCIESPMDADQGLDSDFVRCFQPAPGLYVVPMRLNTGANGVMVADRRFTPSAVGDAELEFLKLLANLTGQAVDRSRRERISATSLSLPTLYSLNNPHDILNVSIESLMHREGAAACCLLLVEGSKITAKFSCGDYRFGDLPYPPGSLPQTIRLAGAGQPWHFSQEEVQAEFSTVGFVVDASCAAAVSVWTDRQAIGTLWVLYSTPQQFDEQRLGRLATEMSHVASAYLTRLQWNQELALTEAIQDLGRLAHSPDIVQAVADLGRRIFKADMATFWAYDRETGKFNRNWSRFSGWPTGQLPPSPQFGRTTYTLLSGENYRAEEQLSATDHEWSQSSGRSPLSKLGFLSFQGVALGIEGQELGVLYLTYKAHKIFTRFDRDYLCKFADIGALALQRAKLIEETSRLRAATGMLASFTKEATKPGILKTVAAAIEKAIHAKAVFLYTFDSERDCFDNEPTVSSCAHEPQLRARLRRASELSLLPHLMRDSPGWISRREIDIFLDAPKQLSACLSLPLRLEGSSKAVGLLLAFPESGEEDPLALGRAEAFGPQIAAACQHAQNSAVADELAIQQQSLVDLTRSLLDAKRRLEAFDYCLQVAVRVLDVEFADIVMIENGNLVFARGLGWPADFEGKHLRQGASSHAGFTINEGITVVVDDFSNEVRFDVPPDIEIHEIVSGMGTPMKFGSDIIGAILVHTTKLRRFREGEKTFLSLVAGQVALATRFLDLTAQAEEFVRGIGRLASDAERLLLRSKGAGSAG